MLTEQEQADLASKVQDLARGVALPWDLAAVLCLALEMIAEDCEALAKARNYEGDPWRQLSQEAAHASEILDWSRYERTTEGGA